MVNTFKGLDAWITTVIPGDERPGGIIVPTLEPVRHALNDASFQARDELNSLIWDLDPNTEFPSTDAEALAKLKEITAELQQAIDRIENDEIRSHDGPFRAEY